MIVLIAVLLAHGGHDAISVFAIKFVFHFRKFLICHSDPQKDEWTPPRFAGSG
jgi:hypothetical protein